MIERQADKDRTAFDNFTPQERTGLLENMHSFAMELGQRSQTPKVFIPLRTSDRTPKNS